MSRPPEEPPEDPPEEPLDLRLLLPAGAAWAAAWCTLAAPLALSAAGVALLWVVAGLALARAARGDRARVVALVALATAAASLAALVRAEPLRSGPVAGLAAVRATVTATVTVTGDPVGLATRRAFGGGEELLVVVPVRLEELQGRGQRWQVRVPVSVFARDAGWLSLLPSQRLTLRGRLGTEEGGRPVAALPSVTGPPPAAGPPSAVQRAAGHLRAGLRTAVEDLPAGPRGLVPGLVDGDTSLLPE